MASSSLPPLLPKIDAILVLDGDGNRLAGKYYGDFMKSASAADPSTANGATPPAQQQGTEQLRASFERQIHAKIGGSSARPDAAEVVTVLGRTCVYVGGRSASASSSGGGAAAEKSGGARGGGASSSSAPGDVRIVHVGPAGESELLLAHLCEGMYEALSHLMGGTTDRNMILDNLELVFLLIDEHCDGGIILETDGHKLANSVLLRDGSDGRMDPTPGSAGAGGGQGEKAAPPSGGGFSMGGLGGDMTIAQALMQARNQIISNLSQS
jgi:hypothetical protein